MRTRTDIIQDYLETRLEEDEFGSILEECGIDPYGLFVQLYLRGEIELPDSVILSIEELYDDD